MSEGCSCLPCFNPQGLTSSSAGSEPRVVTVCGELNKVQQSSTNIALKVKRMKTKKERNLARFKKSETERVVMRRCSGNFLRTQDPCSLSSCRRVVPPFAVRGACNSNPVIITHNRLTQQLGMFSREVKSVDIGRLISNDIMKDRVQEPFQGTKTHSQGSSGQEGMASKLDITPVIQLKSQGGNASLEHKALKTDLQCIEPATVIPQNEENENHLPMTLRTSEIQTTSFDGQKVPVLDAANEILKMLNPHLLFPGRNLVTETRKSIMAKMKQQGSAHINQTALSVQRKQDHNSRVTPDVSECSGQEHLKEMGRDGSKTGHESQSKMKKQRSLAQVMSSSRHSPLQIVMNMVQAKGNGQQRQMDPFHQTVLQKHYFNLQCSQKHHLQDAKNHSHVFQPISAMEQPELVIDSRSSLERNTEAFRKAMRQSQSYNHPETLYNPRPRGDFTYDYFQPTFSYTHGCPKHIARHATSPKQCKVSHQEPPINGHLHEIFQEELTNTGLRNRFRSAEEQISFDVLKSTWSSHNSDLLGHSLNESTQEAKLSCVDINSQREDLNRNFLNQHGFLPGDMESQFCIGPVCLQQEDDRVSHMKSQDLRNVKSMQRPRAQRLKAYTGLHQTVLPLTGIPRWKHISEWSPMVTVSPVYVSMDSIENMGGNEWHNDDWSHTIAHSTGQQGQLSTSLFSPTESMEQRNSFTPLPKGGSVRQTLLERLSPDNWVYPRMKLY